MTIARQTTKKISLVPRVSHVRQFETGFTLVELLITLLVFLVIGGAAVMLVQKHVKIFTGQQNQSALNIMMRQAVAQIQTDVINAGAGYYTSVNVPGSPIGLTIVNGTGTTCYNSTTHVYSSSCFDSLNVLAFDSAAPTAPITSTNLATCGSTSCTMTLASLDSSVSSTTIASSYTKGSELLFLTGGTSTPSVMTVTLLANATTSSSGVVVTFTPVALVSGSTTSYANPNELYSITTVASDRTTISTFDNTSYVLKLSPITYSIDTTDGTNPQLIRTQNSLSSVLVDHVVAFKVGAQLWNSSTTNVVDDNAQYSYAQTDYNANYSMVRGARVTLVGRTPVDVNSSFVNSFDGGPYRIEAISTVVSPRNLSMNDGN